MAEDKETIDDNEFDRIMVLAYAFDENKKQEKKIPWEKMKPEIEKLSTTEMEILLGLVKTKVRTSTSG